MARAEDDRAWDDYAEHFRGIVFPEIVGSGVFVTIYGGDGTDFDVKQATELGAMLLLDKPLLVICGKGVQLPVRLGRAADIALTDFDMADPGAQERVMAAITTLREGQQR